MYQESQVEHADDRERPTKRAPDGWDSARFWGWF